MMDICGKSLIVHPTNIPEQITLLPYSHPINPPHQPTPSTHSINSFSPPLHPSLLSSSPLIKSCTPPSFSSISGAFTERGHLHSTRTMGQALGLGLVPPTGNQGYMSSSYGSMTARSPASVDSRNSANHRYHFF